MKTIEERAWEKYPEVIKHHNLAHIDINEEKRKMYIEIATEQKAIDDAILLKLKSAWEKQAQINHDDVANYKQGYHDAVEKFCELLRSNWRKYVYRDRDGGILFGHWESDFRKVMKE